MTSILVYGSMARGSYDELSDRDVLICDAPGTDLYKKHQFFKRKGWSVYTTHYGEFRKMAEKGYLFYHHLKDEGRIIRDDDSQLEAIFSRIGQPFVDMRRVIEDLSYLKSLPRGLSYWSDACLSDVYYVFLRNAFINIGYKLGVTNFDFNESLKNVGNAAFLDPHEVKAILDLRKLKSNYRNRIIDGSADFDAIDRGISKIEYLVALPIPSQDSDNGYQALRRIELDLTSAYSAPYLDRRDCVGVIPEIWKTIKKPYNYPDIWTAVRLYKAELIRGGR